MVRRPNIVLITTDQEQHWSLLPPGLRLEAHERLLAAGTGFTRYHVVTTPCGPSRSTIYTGRHTKHTGVVANPSPQGSSLATSVATLGHMLRDVGYYTAYKGKWHLSMIDPAEPFVATTAGALDAYGFADYSLHRDPVGIAWDGYREDPSIASEAAAWLTGGIGGKPDDRPWMLAVNFVNPHDVMFFDARGGRAGAVGRALPAPRSALYEKDWDVALPASLALEDPATKPAAQAGYARFWSEALGGPDRDDEAAWRRLRSYYFNCLRDVDRHVATVLDALEEAGHRDDTIVVYTTDHGEHAGAHGLRDKQISVYREVTNAPLIVTHPDLEGGTTSDALGSAIDLVPTLLAFAGLDGTRRAERFPELRGHDLSACVLDPAAPSPRTALLFYMSTLYGWDPDYSAARRRVGEGTADPADEALVAGGQRLDRRVLMRGLFDGTYKLARYFAPSNHHRPEGEALFAENDLELYDTAADPGEVRNLAGDPTWRALVEVLNAQLNDLVDDEVGVDDGSELGGDPRRYVR